MRFRSHPQQLFSTAVTLIAMSGVIAAATMYVLFASERRLRHSYQVQLSIARIGADLARAGRSRTAFVDSGDRRLLANYESARTALQGELKQLQSLLADNPQQEALCSLMEANAHERLRVLKDSIDLAQSGQSDLATQARLTSQIVALAVETAQISDQMHEAEELLLQKRRELTYTLFVAILVVLLAILILAVVLLRKYYHLLAAELLERRAAEQNAQLLSTALMKAQDEERRKFSRELHDSLGQTLVGAKMVADQLHRRMPQDTLSAEISEMLESAVNETRTLSHLLHPPLLDEIGFVVAAREFIDNFSKRTGIAVSFDCPERLPKLPRNMDLTLFRVLQEALTNVHRHSESAKADAALTLRKGGINLQVTDYGVGMSPATLRKLQTTGTGVGVGLAGMRGRVKEQGGRLAVASDNHGTTISVSFDLPQESTADSGSETDGLAASLEQPSESGAARSS